MRKKKRDGLKIAMDFKDALPRGGFIGTTRTNVFVNDGGEAYIREPNGNFKFDGMYTPEIHGPVFPKAEAPKKQDELKIANLADGRPDASIMNYVTEKGYFLDGQGKAYQQRGGQFGGGTEYNPDIHGLPVPLVKNRKKLKIGTA